MKQWTLEDAPELHRDEARHYAGAAVNWLVTALKIGLHSPHWGFHDSFALLKYAERDAERAVAHATRYRDTKRAVSELRNTLHDFEHFCRDLCGKSPVYHTFEHVLQDHADMLSETDWEDDDVCFCADTLSARERAGEG